MIKWNDSFNIGHEEIDKQHFKLFGIMMNLYNSFQENLNTNKILEYLNQLKDYTKTHFRLEEMFMIQNKYKDFNLHKNEHLYFEKKIENLFLKVENSLDVFNIPKEVVMFLQDWFCKHILELDKKLKSFFL